jgi:hypothetical protein
MDRHHYAEHALTGAASVRNARAPDGAPDRLRAVRRRAAGIRPWPGNEEDPALWQRDYGGEIEHWIDLGQPDESRIRKACGRARQVTVVNYGGHAAELWWNRQAATLGKLKNLSVIERPAGHRRRLAAAGTQHAPDLDDPGR